VTDRPDPQGTETARRLAARNALVREGLTQMAADAWVAAWERERPIPVAERGPDYWGQAVASVLQERREWVRRPKRYFTERS
jgi:hypothetical protein